MKNANNQPGAAMTILDVTIAMIDDALHRKAVEQEISYAATGNRRITADVADVALAMYDFHLDLGTQYNADTKWTEVTPADVAAVFLHKALDRTPEVASQ